MIITCRKCARILDPPRYRLQRKSTVRAVAASQDADMYAEFAKLIESVRMEVRKQKCRTGSHESLAPFMPIYDI